ncbi:MAG: hypothetical protein EAZ85_06985 [Bacteroidetes bacterium]|nr:MAG: hypothetical protein EAZ85_06985 [Bacteroidota bacterium]
MVDEKCRNKPLTKYKLYCTFRHTNNGRKILRFLQIIGTSGKVHLYKLKQIQKKNKEKNNLKKFSIQDLKWQQNEKKNFWIACKFWWKEE